MAGERDSRPFQVEMLLARHWQTRTMVQERFNFRILRKPKNDPAVLSCNQEGRKRIGDDSKVRGCSNF